MLIPGNRAHIMSTVYIYQALLLVLPGNEANGKGTYNETRRPNIIIM